MKNDKTLFQHFELRFNTQSVNRDALVLIIMYSNVFNLLYLLVLKLTQQFPKSTSNPSSISSNSGGFDTWSVIFLYDCPGANERPHLVHLGEYFSLHSSHMSEPLFSLMNCLPLSDFLHRWHRKHSGWQYLFSQVAMGDGGAMSFSHWTHRCILSIE